MVYLPLFLFSPVTGSLYPALGRTSPWPQSQCSPPRSTGHDEV